MRDGLSLLEERERVRESKLAALRSDIRDGLDSGPSMKGVPQKPIGALSVGTLHGA